MFVSTIYRLNEIKPTEKLITVSNTTEVSSPGRISIINLQATVFNARMSRFNPNRDQ